MGEWVMMMMMPPSDLARGFWCREQKVEVTIYTLRSGVVRVEDSESALYASIDLVCDKVRACK